MTFEQFLNALDMRRRELKAEFKVADYGMIREKVTGCCPIEFAAGLPRNRVRESTAVLGLPPQVERAVILAAEEARYGGPGSTGSFDRLRLMTAAGLN